MDKGGGRCLICISFLLNPSLSTLYFSGLPISLIENVSKNMFNEGTVIPPMYEVVCQLLACTLSSPMSSSKMCWPIQYVPVEPNTVTEVDSD